MIRSLLNLAWRQRRMAFVLAVLLMSVQRLGPEDLERSAVFLTIVFAATFTILYLGATIMLMILGGLRLGVFLGFTLALLAANLPDPFVDEPWHGMIGFVIFVVLLACFASETVDRFLPTVRFSGDGSFRTEARPRAVLDALIPGHGPPRAYFGAIHEVAPDPDDPALRHVRYLHRRGLIEPQTVRIEASTPRGGAYAFADDAGPLARRFNTGRGEVTISAADTKGLRAVRATWRFESKPIRIAILDWLADRHGSDVDAAAAMLRRDCDLSGSGTAARLSRANA